MKTRIIGLFVALAAVGAGVGMANCAGEPEQGCPVPHLSVFVKYTLVDTAQAAEPCGQLGVGEPWSFSKYNQPGTTVNTIAIRPDRVGVLANDERLDDADKPDWTGGYDYSPDQNGFCAAHDLTPVEIDVPEMPVELEDGGMDTPLPAEAFSMTVTSLQLVGTPAVPGTQFKGELDYTAGGCTAHYTLLGIAPLVECETDDQCNAQSTDGGNEPACNDFGECLNPDFVMQCDTETGVCMPNGEIPSLIK